MMGRQLLEVDLLAAGTLSTAKALSNLWGGKCEAFGWIPQHPFNSWNSCFASPHVLLCSTHHQLPTFFSPGPFDLIFLLYYFLSLFALLPSLR